MCFRNNYACLYIVHICLYWYNLYSLMFLFNSRLVKQIQLVLLQFPLKYWNLGCESYSTSVFVGGMNFYMQIHPWKTNMTIEHQPFEDIPSRKLTYPPKNGILFWIFLFPRWDMLIPWRVYFLLKMLICHCHVSFQKGSCTFWSRNIRARKSTFKK